MSSCVRRFLKWVISEGMKESKNFQFIDLFVHAISNLMVLPCLMLDVVGNE